MIRTSESERLEHAHTLWCLAAQCAAGDISHAEYEEGFWAHLGEYGEVFELRARSAPPLPYVCSRPGTAVEIRERCAA